MNRLPLEIKEIILNLILDKYMCAYTFYSKKNNAFYKTINFDLTTLKDSSFNNKMEFIKVVDCMEKDVITHFIKSKLNII